jgi:hypothetical protein
MTRKMGGILKGYYTNPFETWIKTVRALDPGNEGWSSIVALVFLNFVEFTTLGYKIEDKFCIKATNSQNEFREYS